LKLATISESKHGIYTLDDKN